MKSIRIGPLETPGDSLPANLFLIQIKILIDHTILLESREDFMFHDSTNRGKKCLLSRFRRFALFDKIILNFFIAC